MPRDSGPRRDPSGALIYNALASERTLLKDSESHLALNHPCRHSRSHPATREQALAMHNRTHSCWAHRVPEAPPPRGVLPSPGFTRQSWRSGKVFQQKAYTRTPSGCTFQKGSTTEKPQLPWLHRSPALQSTTRKVGYASTQFWL